jgi:hypothetical protein
MRSASTSATHFELRRYPLAYVGKEAGGFRFLSRRARHKYPAAAAVFCDYPPGTRKPANKGGFRAHSLLISPDGCALITSGPRSIATMGVQKRYNLSLTGHSSNCCCPPHVDRCGCARLRSHEHSRAGLEPLKPSRPPVAPRCHKQQRILIEARQQSLCTKINLRQTI